MLVDSSLSFRAFGPVCGKKQVINEKGEIIIRQVSKGNVTRMLIQVEEKQAQAGTQVGERKMCVVEKRNKSAFRRLRNIIFVAILLKNTSYLKNFRANKISDMLADEEANETKSEAFKRIFLSRLMNQKAFTKYSPSFIRKPMTKYLNS